VLAIVAKPPEAIVTNSGAALSVAPLLNVINGDMLTAEF